MRSENVSVLTSIEKWHFSNCRKEEHLTGYPSVKRSEEGKLALLAKRVLGSNWVHKLRSGNSSIFVSWTTEKSELMKIHLKQASVIKRSCRRMA
jgi:hypothetical protein